MEAIPKCDEHKYGFVVICTTCKKKLCPKCITAHPKLCSGNNLVDFKTYAQENVLPDFEKRLENYEKSKPEIEISMKEFENAIPILKKTLTLLQEKLENLLRWIKKTLEHLDKKPTEPSVVFERTKQEYLKQVNDLKLAIDKDDINYLIKVVDMKGMQVASDRKDGEKSLIVEANSIASRLCENKDVEGINDCLQNLHEICKRINSDNYFGGAVAVVNRFVYGICDPKNGRKELCQYDINAKKLKSLIPVLYMCSLLQITDRIFITGGNTSVSTTSEYIEKTNCLISKSNMNYGRHAHKMIAISNNNFWAIGGHNGNVALAYCEEYSISENKWNILPSLNTARYYSGTILSGGFVYAIGGCSSNGTIERIDIKLKDKWNLVVINSNEININYYITAFSISDNEVMIFTSGSSDAGIYNIQKGIIKKCEFSIMSDYYYHNSPALIDSNACILGSNGHIHKYSIPDKKLEEYKFSAINS